MRHLLALLCDYKRMCNGGSIDLYGNSNIFFN